MDKASSGPASASRLGDRGAQLDPDAMIAAARATAGLHDFGDDWWERPFRDVVGFINAEAGLTAPDVSPVLQLQGYLVDRLRLVDYLKRNPEALDEPVEVRGIIIGMPRGGSTLLQRLVSTSPQLTSPLFWEGISPLPLPGETPGDPAERKRIGRETARAMGEAWPNMKSMHPIGPEAYEEDTALVARAFVSMMYISIFHIPSYVAWQFEQDHDRVYAELKIWLQVLQHQDPSRRSRKWLLKTSDHLLSGGLCSALRVFPTAKAIMSHRAIEKVVGSWCSLQFEMLKPAANRFPPAALGPEAVELFEHGLRVLMEARRTFGPARFTDVRYEDLVADPIGQFRHVLEDMGLVVGEADLAAARSWMAANGRDTHPSHRYALEDYGVTAAGVRQALAFYLDSADARTAQGLA